MPKAKVKKKAAKKPVKKAVPKKKAVAKKETPVKKKEKFFEAIGRRKTATARVRISVGFTKEILVNGKGLKEYFPTLELQEIVRSPLALTELLEKYGVVARVRGGGVSAQAEAVRHGIAKNLVSVNPELRQTLKKAGYLTRDPRMRERKKFGLKRARRAPQWSKR